MPATMRQITFNAAAFAAATSTPVAASGTVRFVRERAFVSGGQFIEPGRYDAAYAAGAFTAPVWLAVPDDADEAAAYTAKIDGAAYPFSLASGAAVDLATLITAAGVEDVSAVSQLLATKEDALGDPAANGYVLSSTTGGTRSWIVLPTAEVTQAELDAVSATVATKEPALGNPGTSGYVLSSTTAGVRSWIANETTPGPWIALTLLGTWVAADFGGSPITPAYRVNGSIVEFRGAVKNGADSSFIASGLPAAAYRQEDVCRSAVAGILRADVDGTLRHIAGSLTIIGLDAFTYRTTT